MKRTGHYQIEESKDGQFYFTLSAGNGELLSTGETVKSKQSVFKAIRSMRWNAFWGKVVDNTKSNKHK